MDIDCPTTEPNQERPSHLYNLIGSAIALLTLVLPLYFTSHYSSGNTVKNSVKNTPLPQPSSLPVQP